MMMTTYTSKVKTADVQASKRMLNKISWVVALGVVLNPLNSSMIAVALLDIGSSFNISVSMVTWLITGFYLAAAVGQPLMGKLADLLGPKRVFISGMVLVIISSLLSIWPPSFGALLFYRVIQAFGSIVAFPAGLTIIRSVSSSIQQGNTSSSSASALGVISIAANVMAAFGPTIGGVLVANSGWEAIFWINIPIAVIVLALSLFWLPRDQIKLADMSKKEIVHKLDIPGIGLFSMMLISFMLFLVTLSESPHWWLLAVSPLAGFLLVYRELRTKTPFLDVRMLASNVKLNSVFAKFTGLNLVFYSLFFSLPLWLGEVLKLDPQTAGLMMLPFAGMGVITTPIAVQVIRKYNYRVTLIIGSSVLVLGTLLLLLLDENTPLIVIVLIMAVIGIPNGFNNMGLQTALYRYSSPEETGTASGLYQTFRSIGSLLSTSLLGLIYGGVVTTEGLHLIAIVTVVISVILLAASLSKRLT